MTVPAFASIHELSGMLDAGSVDAVELTEHFLKRTERFDGGLNCFVLVAAELARSQAQASSQRAKRGRRLGPLDGIPVAVKDNIDIAGLPSGNGLGGQAAAAAEDADVVKRLQAAGAVILGKLNMHEIALGGTTDNPHTGATINPWRAGYSPGGSSGGSGAAVAAGLCVAALGTDTAGSVRLPAAYCGVVGLKPSHDVISLDGVALLSRPHDTVGPLTRRSGDAALLLEHLALPEQAAALQPGGARLASLAGVRFGIVRNFEAERIGSDVLELFEGARRVLGHGGARFVDVDVAGYDPAAIRRAAFAAFEIAASRTYGAGLVAEPARFSPELRGYLEWGRGVSPSREADIAANLDAAGAAFAQALAGVDAMLSPTAPQVAFAHGEKAPTSQNSFTTLANLAGTPAISVPMGVTAGGLPAGLQICTARGHDYRALALADFYERAAAWKPEQHTGIQSRFG